MDIWFDEQVPEQALFALLGDQICLLSIHVKFVKMEGDTNSAKTFSFLRKAIVLG